MNSESIKDENTNVNKSMVVDHFVFDQDKNNDTVLRNLTVKQVRS